MMMNMTMRWVYVSELRPPAGLLFIPHVIYEHGEPRWNDIGRGTPDLSTTALWKFYSYHLVGKQEELGEETMNLALRSISIYT
jgi:hypothetical protein